MKVQLTQTVRDLAKGACREKDARAVLTGVMITDKEAVVTDGYMLIIKPLAAPEMPLQGILPDDGNNKVIVPADALKVCSGKVVTLETIETQRHRPSNELNISDPIKTVLIVRLEGSEFSIEAEEIEGEYPNYMQMFQPSLLVTQIGFDTNVLKRLISCLPTDSFLKMRISDPGKTIEFQCEDPDGGLPIRGIITPKLIGSNALKWNCIDTNKGDEIISKAIDNLHELSKSQLPKINDNTVTIESGGKSVTVTDKQLHQASKKIKGNSNK